MLILLTATPASAREIGEAIRDFRYLSSKVVNQPATNVWLIRDDEEDFRYILTGQLCSQDLEQGQHYTITE